MKKLVFDYKKFKGLVTSYAVDEAAAEIAQSIFDEWLKGATVVYAEGNNQPWHNVSFQGATHKALVIGIEPIKPKCEKHQVVIDYEDYCFKCKRCGQQMQPTGWKEKE